MSKKGRILRHFVGRSIDKIVVQKQGDGHIEAAVIIVQVQVADLLNFFQPVDEGVAVKKELPGGLHHVAVVGQVDAQRLEVVGAVGPVVLEQLLKMPTLGRPVIGLLLLPQHGALQSQARPEVFAKGCQTSL